MRASNSCLFLVAMLAVGGCSASGGGGRRGPGAGGGESQVGSNGNPGNGDGTDKTDKNGSDIIETGDGVVLCDPSSSDPDCRIDGPAPAGCGDGFLTADEACDDGNQEDGDGCAANCLSVAPGYSCMPSGRPCHPISRCGDKIKSETEQCDDGNTDDGDGCSARCRIEVGFKCSGEPSECSHTQCGDKEIEGAESCEDGNAIPFDGCSAQCQKEPSCTSSGCVSECGDGLVIGEECDDGNRISGDGCSADCKVEKGFQCSQQANCEKVDGECVLRVPVLWRDFIQKNEPGGHPDFQPDCQGEEAALGGVETKLNDEGRPVLKDGQVVCIQSKESFNQWFTNNSFNSAIPGTIVLYDNKKGGFVNRYGQNGEPWTVYTDDEWCNSDYTVCETDTTPGTKCKAGCHKCSWITLSSKEESAAGCNGTKNTYDGNPVFFPLDNAEKALKDKRYEAKVPPPYNANWVVEKDIIPEAGLHNFHFTSEVNYWFQYDAKKSATLDFTGDDDVWVFVNGVLAVDLGGLHKADDGSVTLAAATASKFGLEDKKVYKITVFHAERKLDSSTFRLTLEGFNTVPSFCEPICGDGIVVAGEECDDGKNDGGYGECAEGCKLGAYCGDGIVQEGESCDDGNRFDGDACGSACRFIAPAR